jgi:hypothetical protein
VEHGEGAVGVFAHFDARLDVVSARRAGGQLQRSAAIGDGVVMGHHALLLDAQGLSEQRRIRRHEGVVRERGRPGEPRIVRRQVAQSLKPLDPVDTFARWANADRRRPLPRKLRPLCGVRNRRGEPCAAKVVPLSWWPVDGAEDDRRKSENRSGGTTAAMGVSPE